MEDMYRENEDHMCNLIIDNMNIDTPIKVIKKKKKRLNSTTIKKFEEIYIPTGELLGEGSFGSVQTYKSLAMEREFAVKVVSKTSVKTRLKVLKEIEIFHYCQGSSNILQLIEYFEEDMRFYLVFEKMEGGTLLETIEKRGHLSEQEASLVIRDIANALQHLHKKGIAHRDLKPENILCAVSGQLTPVKICDFDLGSGIHISSRHTSPITTPELQSPVGSAEFMAPEVVGVWQERAWSYDKKCDIWSLGIILYILLCGYPPFHASCGGNCSWEEGGSCNACQDQLFDNIRGGVYDFPEEDWSGISGCAKDLICHLLVTDPSYRYSAEEVLQHHWVTKEGSHEPLATPDVLKRINSVRELQAFAENANALNRLIVQHLSISQSYDTCPMKYPSSDEEDNDNIDQAQYFGSLHEIDEDFGDFDEESLSMTPGSAVFFPDGKGSKSLILF